MTDLKTLIGEQFIRSDGSMVALTEIDTEYVGLYFSAQWCPPCREFTPALVRFYHSMKGANPKNLELILVSSDKSHAEFETNFKGVPFLGVPYHDERRMKLSKKFRVQGIPVLIIIDKNGNVVCNDGRKQVGQDPTGAKFPWPRKSLAQVLDGPLLTKSREIPASTLLSGKHIALYFSAQWCPPCRGFTPVLAEFYTKFTSKRPSDFEIVFVSSDHSLEEFESYRETMPWAAVPYKDPRSKELSVMFNVQGIPTLVIISPDGQLITTSGRDAIVADPEGLEFPWHPKPLSELSPATIDTVQTRASYIVFLDKCDADTQTKVKEVLQPIATEFFESSKLQGNVDEVPAFLWARAAKLTDRIRQLCGFETREGPFALILDLSLGQFWAAIEDITTDSGIRSFLAAWQGGTIAPTSIDD